MGTGSASVAGRAVWPDDPHWAAAVTGVGHDVGRASIATCGLLVPYGEQFADHRDHEFARSHVRFRCGLCEIKPVYPDRTSDEVIVLIMRLSGQPVPIACGRHDHLQHAALVDYRAGKEL